MGSSSISGSGSGSGSSRHRTDNAAPPPGSSLQDLPDDVLRLVIAAAGGFSRSLRLASKRLAALHDAHVTEVTIRGYNQVEIPSLLEHEVIGATGAHKRSSTDFEHIMRLSSRCRGLTRMDLQHMTASEAHAALTRPVRQRLQQLQLGFCDPGAFKALRACTALQRLVVEFDWSRPSLRRLLPQLPSLSQLQSLILSDCESEDDFYSAILDVGPLMASTLTHLTRLTELAIKNPSYLIHVSGSTLAAMTSLQSLTLHDTEQVDLSAFIMLTRLQRLELRPVVPPEHVGALAALPLLSELSINTWDASGSRLTALTQLELPDVDCADDFMPGVCQLTGLRSLHLPCDALQWDDASARLLGSMTQLGELRVGCCDGVAGAEPLLALQQLQALRVLELSGCPQLASLQPLATLSLLEELHLSECWRVSSLGPLAGLTRLRTLVCKDMKVADLEPLQALKHLQGLSLEGCRQLKSLKPLAGMVQLRQLSLVDCTGTAEPLGALVQLQRLDIHGCCHITSLQPLSTLRQLRLLNVSDCDGISSLQPLRGWCSCRNWT